MCDVTLLSKENWSLFRANSAVGVSSEGDWAKMGPCLDTVCAVPFSLLTGGPGGIHGAISASPVEGRVRHAQPLENGILVFWLGRDVLVALAKCCVFSTETWIWGRERRRPRGQDLQGLCQG